MGYRYIGAKTRIIDWVLSTVHETCETGGHVVDLMTGTASVASALRAAGYRVTANDVMTYSYHHARTALLLSEPPSFSGLADTLASRITTTLFEGSAYEGVLQAITNLDPVEGYFWRELSSGGKPANGERPRNYFTTENAKRIDAARAWIRDAGRQGMIDPLEHSLLLHDLIMAANDVANIAGTYGHYLSKTVERSRVPLALSPTMWVPMPNDVGGHEVIQGYAEAVAATLVADVCYIDPPYMKRQYAANYHVLETLAREDEPEAVGVSGLRPWRDQYSNFCTKTKIHDSFRSIVSGMDCPRLIVSYSEDGLIPIEGLVRLFSEFGDVEVRELTYKRFKSNDSKLSPELTEYLIVLDRR
ncbi:MAG: DNA adenine methylase [Anaerosomatales bacterium]|nr:DNA adenine methylase [Anaerosomatales bacterium]